MEFMKNNLMMDNSPTQSTSTTTTTVMKGEEGKQLFGDLHEEIKKSMLQSLGKYKDMTLGQIIEEFDELHGVKKKDHTVLEMKHKRIKIKVQIKDKKNKETD